VTRRLQRRLNDILDAAAVAQTIAVRGRQAFDDDPVTRLAAEAANHRLPLKESMPIPADRLPALI
jgi:hypothetical protein